MPESTESTDEKQPQTLLRFTWRKPNAKTGRAGKAKTYELDAERLTFGERRDLEEYMGQPWPIVAASVWSLSYKVIGYLAYIAVRRDDPDVELEDFDDLTDDDIKLWGDPEEEDGEDTRPTSTPDDSGRQNSGTRRKASASSRGK